MKMISRKRVLIIAHTFLEECGWKLELEENTLVSIPSNVNLVVATRAYIEEDVLGYTWGNHYQAKVLIEPDEHFTGKYGTLGLYINLEGQLISEDHGYYI